MSVQPDPHIEGYALANNDVVDFFDKYDAFTPTTDPTKKQVERRIRAESDWIDRYTGHAWRPRRVNEEHVTLLNRYFWRAGSPIKLQKRKIITPLDSSKGDKLEVWEGKKGNEGYEEWLSSSDYNSGRNDDYWVEEDTGMLYIFRRKIWFERHKEIRVTYRYGQEWPDPSNKPQGSSLSDAEYKRSNVPQAVRDACAMRVAAHYYESQAYRTTVPGNEEAPDASAVAERWREESEMMLEPYKEVKRIGTL